MAKLISTPLAQTAHRAVKVYSKTLVPGILNKPLFETYLKSSPSGRANGFTLLELLIVIVIVSVLFSFMILTIRGASPEDAIEEEARRFNQLIQLALEEAVLRNTEYGLKFSIHGYQFLQLEENKWQAMDADRLLRPRELPLEMEIEISIEETDIVIEEAEEEPTDDDDPDEDKPAEKNLRPQVFLMSSEEITPEFSARFTIPGTKASYIVKATIDGKHSVEASEL